jgi:hypothetical protein
MYMALHIADPEVNSLVNDLAKLEGTTKTEALRRLLRKTIADREKERKRAGFLDFAADLVSNARNKGVAPVTKQEMDDLWGMSELDGD